MAARVVVAPNSYAWPNCAWSTWPGGVPFEHIDTEALAAAALRRLHHMRLLASTEVYGPVRKELDAFGAHHEVGGRSPAIASCTD